MYAKEMIFLLVVDNFSTSVIGGISENIFPSLPTAIVFTRIQTWPPSTKSVLAHFLTTVLCFLLSLLIFYICQYESLNKAYQKVMILKVVYNEIINPSYV